MAYTKAVRPLHTVVQLDEFISQAKSLMSDDERERIVDFLAAHPGSGTALGGGLFKLRFARPGAGKSGGLRTIYLFVGEKMPIFLLSVFAKNRKENLAPTERVAMIALGKQLIEKYGELR